MLTVTTNREDGAGIPGQFGNTFHIVLRVHRQIFQFFHAPVISSLQPGIFSYTASHSASIFRLGRVVCDDLAAELASCADFYGFRSVITSREFRDRPVMPLTRRERDATTTLSNQPTRRNVQLRYRTHVQSRGSGHRLHHATLQGMGHLLHGLCKL